jgi:hypothetical protein
MDQTTQVDPMPSLINRSLMLSLVFLAIISAMSRLEAVSFNPPPCTEPWTCEEPPGLGGTIFNGDHVCPEEQGIWILSDASILGKKVRCDESADVNIHDVSWAWAITSKKIGETIVVGSDKTALWKPASTVEGDFLLTFTGSATGDDPCNNAISAQVTQPINVPAPTCTATFGTITGCPGEQVVVTASVTNTSTECGFWFLVSPSVAAGDPHVRLDDIPTTIFVGPGQTNTGTVHFTILDDSPIGTKTVHIDVTNRADGNSVPADGSVVVPPHQATATIDSMAACPGETVEVPFEIKNTGQCKGTFTWDITSSSPGVTVTDQGNPPATLAPNASHKGTAKLKVDGQAFKGSEISYKITVSVDGEGVITTADGKLTIESHPTITAKKNSIIAGGIDNDTDTTDVSVSLRCSTGSSTVEISLQGGEGSKPSESFVYHVGLDQVTIGGHHPARLVASGQSIEAGTGQTMTLTVNGGQKTQLRLFSSNKIGESVTITAKASNGSQASTSVDFISSNFDVVIWDGAKKAIAGGGLPGGQNLIATCTLKAGAKAVQGHRLILYCDHFVKLNGDTVSINQDQDPNISSAELQAMNASVLFDRVLSADPTDNKGKADFGFVVLDPRVETVVFAVRDLETFVPNSN